jgi:peptidoglycan LD-endopeptidase LytH
MLRRIIQLSLFVAVASCSQRSPWRIVNTEPTVPTPAQSAQTISVASSPVAAAAPFDASAAAHLRSLVFPVSGGDSTRLDDSFDAPRDGGARRHNAIDIMAPRGSAVLSVQDGRILRLQKSAKGGITVYATDLEGQFVYYYAHLDRYHARMYEGRPLLRGDTLGYVGTTGNAPPNLPHLHFQVMRMPASGQFWNGDPVNPYPLLRQVTTASADK